MKNNLLNNYLNIQKLLELTPNTNDYNKQRNQMTEDELYVVKYLKKQKADKKYTYNKNHINIKKVIDNTKISDSPINEPTENITPPETISESKVNENHKIKQPLIFNIFDDEDDKPKQPTIYKMFDKTIDISEITEHVDKAKEKYKYKMDELTFQHFEKLNNKFIKLSKHYITYPNDENAHEDMLIVVSKIHDMMNKADEKTPQMRMDKLRDNIVENIDDYIEQDSILETLDKLKQFEPITEENAYRWKLTFSELSKLLKKKNK